jgi:hypothetical protein
VPRVLFLVGCLRQVGRVEFNRAGHKGTLRTLGVSSYGSPSTIGARFGTGQGGSVLTADAAHTAAVLQVKATLRARRLRHPAAQRSAEQRQGFVHLDEAVLVDLVGL